MNLLLNKALKACPYSKGDNVTRKKQSILVVILVLNMTTISAQDTVDTKELTYSMKQGISTVKKLLKKVSIYDTFDEDKTLLHYAVKEGDFKIVRFLVDKGIYLSKKGGELYGTALQEAIFYGHIDIAIFLIQQGTLVNEQDVNGDTALHLAARSGDLVLIKTLLNHGASKFILNHNGETPLDLIEDLTWDDGLEMKKILSLKEKKRVKDQTRAVHVDEHETKVINKIDTKSILLNSKVGIQLN